MKSIIQYIRTHYIISGIAALAVVGIGATIVTSNKSSHQLFTVERGAIAQKVAVSGKTKPVQAVDLGFDVSGRVVRSYVDIGSHVTTGQTLVSLDQSQAAADLLKAQADVASAQAQLDELMRGTRPEELAVSQTEVANAQVSLNDARANLAAKLADAYSSADDAIHNNVDQLFSNPRSNNPQFNLTVTDIQVKNDINQGRFTIEGVLSAWRDGSASTSASTAQMNLTRVKSFIDSVASAVNSQSAASNLSQTTVDAYKASVSAARTNVLAAINNVTTAEEKVNNAQSALTLAQKNLTLKQVGNTEEAIRSQQAKVLQNQAQVQNVQAQIAKMSIRSPLTGVVTKQDAKVGEIVTAGKNVVSVISDSDLEIESNVSEVSIGKVAVGNPVDITLDAFSGETFKGTVSYIEPAETIVDGVVNYKVTIAFAEKYPQMKSGLTTNMDIITATKADVIRVPQYALIRNADGVFVLKQSGKEWIKVPVTVGVISQDGFAEIISGVSVGDVIDMAPPTSA